MDVSMDVFPGATIVGAPVYRFKQAFWSGIRANVQLCRRGAGGPDIIGRDNFVHGGDAVGSKPARVKQPADTSIGERTCSMPTYWFAAVMAGLVFGSPALGSDDGWKDAGTKDGIELAYRDDPELAAREARATAELPFPISSIVPIVCDLSQYEELVPGVLEATLLDGDSRTDYEVYLRYAARFLVVAPRDVVLRVQAFPEVPGAAGCSWSELTGRVAEREGTVRMPLLRGEWTIDALDEMRSRVVYRVTVRPGGRIPTWLVRRGAVQALPEVIENVRKRLSENSHAP
jgi:Polyketide cyclase / dehydrase and lipid transport